MLKHLFTPGKIGRLELKNRVIQAPMGTWSYDENGVPSQQTVDYFVARAKGGVALIILHSVRISPELKMPGLPNLYDDKFIPIMRVLADAIHQAGAKCALMMNHFGKAMTTLKKADSIPFESYAIGPSPITYVKSGLKLREASKEDIGILIERFSDCARRIKQAGFDMVELHAAHGYLMSSFLSPLTNHRTDEYGGSPENRARFVCEIVRRIRDKAGSDFPISVRFSGSDFLPGGTTIQDSVVQAKAFEEAGADLLHVSAGSLENTEVQFLSYLWPNAFLAEHAKRIKESVSIPVCAVGKIADPAIANSLIEEGKADFISLGRPLLADPNWVTKAKDGRASEINRCIYCNNCVDRLFTETRAHKRLFCTVNPYLFREREYEIRRAPHLKKVMVIGGGLAGMQAAEIAAIRGHDVTLYESTSQLGGAWNIAALQPGKEHYNHLTIRLQEGIKRAGVKVILTCRVDAELVKSVRPDCVIIATGAKPIVPNIPGAKGSNVVQAVDVILGNVEIGQRVVVIGGRMVGMETALYLSEKGKRVSIATLKRLGENGKQLEDNIYRTLRDKLIEIGVQVFSHTPVFEIRPDGVFASDGGNILWLPSDTVVLAVGYESYNALPKTLEGEVAEIYTIGDCNSPRDALEATREGMKAGQAV